MQDKYGFLLEVASRQIKQAFQRKLQLEGSDLTVDQWVVIDRLSRGALPQIQLATAVYKDPPTLTRILDLLCLKGLTIRQPDATDRRKFLIELTEKGKQLFEKLQPRIAEFRELGWQGLSREDYAHFHRILSAVMHNFDIEAAGALSLSTAIADSQAA